jgi:hypothetical protein
MADNTLKAFELGASLYDRAQTQKRMMEQFQQQTAESLLQRQGLELQNKIRDNELANGISERAKFSADLPKIQAWQSAYVQWNAKGDPTQPFPAPPSDLQSATGLKMLGDMSGPVLQSLPMAQNRFIYEKALTSETSALNKEIDFLTENGKGDVVLQYNGGLDPETRKINPEFRKAIFDAAAPLRQEQARMKKLTAIGMAGQRNTKEGLKNLLDSGDITQQEYEQLLPTARTEGGVVAQRANQVLEGLKKQKIVQTDEDEINAKVFLGGPNQGKVPADVSKALTAANRAVVELDDVFKKLNAFESKYGKGSFSEYVGPLDSPIFDLKGRFKGLTSQEQKDARDIHGKIKLVVTDYQNNKYGATLTPSETDNLQKVVSTPARNDYIQVISSFKDNLRSGAENSIWDYRFSPDIPYDIKNRYLEGARQKFGFEQPSAAVSAVGISQEQPLSPQDVFKNIRQTPQGGGLSQPASTQGKTRIRLDAQGNVIQ